MHVFGEPFRALLTRSYWFSPPVTWPSLQCHFRSSKRRLLYYASTSLGFFRDPNHVTARSDGFVILGAHVISPPCQRRHHHHSNPLWADTERVCYRRNKDQCAVSSHSRLTGSIERGRGGGGEKKKKGRQQTSFVFPKTRFCLLLCSGLWCQRHGSSSPRPPGSWFFKSFGGRWALIKALVLFPWPHPPCLPLLQTLPLIS